MKLIDKKYQLPFSDTSLWRIVPADEKVRADIFWELTVLSGGESRSLNGNMEIELMLTKKGRERYLQNLAARKELVGNITGDKNE